MTNELKPCPFCGDKMEATKQLFYHKTQRPDCPISKQAFVNEMTGIWNTRAEQTGGMVSKYAVIKRLNKIKGVFATRSIHDTINGIYKDAFEQSIKEIEAIPCSNDKFVEALCSVTAAAKEMLSNLNNMDDEVEWPKSIERAEKLLKDKGSNKPENIMMETNLSFDEFNQEMAARGADVETGYVTDGNIHHNDDDKGAR